jgi:hypothetical protein
VRIADREHTGVGCYSRLVLSPDAPTSAAPYAAHGPLSGPHFESKVVTLGGGTLLWFKAGRADLLEIYAFGDFFPSDHADLGNFKLESRRAEYWRRVRQFWRAFLVRQLRAFRGR